MSNVDLSLASARDLATMVEASEGQLRCFVNADIIVCATCKPGWDPLQPCQTAYGVFRYNMTVGVRFPKPARLPREFINLKQAIRTHFSGASHNKNEAAKKKAQAARERQEKAARAVSIRVLRTAYHVIKRSHPRAEFERLIVLQHMNGADMGDLCHSGSQMARFRKAFGDSVLSALTRHVQHSPCVAWVADKVTLNSRTIDITAIISVFPEADAGELIQSLVVGAPVVTEHDGTALATEWVETAARIAIKHPGQLAAICTDGQFHHGSVPTKFLQLLTTSLPDYAERSVPPAVPCLWDGAHLMDLADGAARKEVACTWVNDTVETISRITRRFTLGQNRERLRKTSERLKLPFRGLQLWSETRFSPHAANVLENFGENMRIIAAAMGDMIDAPSTRSVAAIVEDLKNDLRLLTGNQTSL